MSDNKFIERLKGKNTSKSVLEIKNEATKASFANMPSGTSNAIDVYSDHRGDATAVLNGTINWKISDNNLILANDVAGNGQDFDSIYSVSGAGLWVDSVYTFPSTGDPLHPIAMVFNPTTKWVLKVCGDNFIVDGGSIAEFTLLIKIGTSNIFTKQFSIKEQAGQFCKEFVLDFNETNAGIIKASGLTTLTVQLLCGAANASARIYNGMTVLTCLQRKVDASAVSTSFANVEEALQDGMLPSDYFNNAAFIDQVTDGEEAYAVFQRDGDTINLSGWTPKDAVAYKDEVIIKAEVMPTPNADLVGAIYQYTGITSAPYEHGYIYECSETNPGVYSWERIDVQPGGSRGRFLSLWNCVTGLPESTPPISPYEYKTGDYYIVSAVSTATPPVNYKPDGSSYTTGVASTTVETNEVSVNDTYFYDGSVWKLQSNAQKEVSFSALAGSPYDNTNLSNALNAKQNTLTAGANISIVNDVISSTAQESFFRGNFNEWTDVPTDTSLYQEDIHGNRVPKDTDFIIVEDASQFVPSGSLMHKLVVENLQATEGFTIRITDENGVSQKYYYAPYARQFVAIDDYYSLKYMPGNPGVWYIKTNDGSPIIIKGTTYSSGETQLCLTTDPATPFDAGMPPSAGEYTGAWRFAYYGVWSTAGITGWTPQYKIENTLPIADSQTLGIAKLYTTTGNNTDGSMTQKSITDALDTKQDTLTAGTGIDITSATISNSGVRSVSSGTTNGTISVNTNGTSTDVSVTGLGSAAYTSSSDYATSVQGGKADTAVQPGDLATVATTGDYDDLLNKPTIMTGASAGDAGTSGLVPAPAAGDQAKFLQGDGTWVNPTAATAWGNITGTLSDQTDLQNALNAKADDNAVVHLSGSETITGTKIFRDIQKLNANTLKCFSIARGTVPGSTQYANYYFTDSAELNGDNNAFGLLRTQVNTSGNVSVYLRAFKNNVAGTNVYSDLSLVYPASGNPYASAPASDVNNSIVTTVDKSKGSGGFFKLGNGLIIQWGVVSANSSGVAVTLPTAFSSATSYRAVACREANNATMYVSVVRTSASKITVYTSNATSYSIAWIAIGY